jgi:hypothetical protein
LLACLLSGCAKPYKVARVSGRVTLDGKPLAKASITFVPQATKENIAPGPTAAAFTDDDGRFTLGINKDTPGSVVNKCRVFITSLVGDSTPTDQDGGPPSAKKPPKDKVPPKYNTETTLTFDVPPEGTDQANFDLKSR